MMSVHSLPQAAVRRFGLTVGPLQYWWPRQATWDFYAQVADSAADTVVLGEVVPAFEKLTTFKTWAEEGPPKGTLYHYPNPHNHQTLSIAAAPAPHKIAEQIYTQAIQTQMVVRYAKGEAMEKTLDWAAGEIEGFSRN